MPAMEVEQLRQVTHSVRTNLEKARRAITLQKLADAIGVSESEARQAVMRLIDSQEAVVTRIGTIKAIKKNIRRRQRLRALHPKALH